MLKVLLVEQLKDKNMKVYGKILIMLFIATLSLLVGCKTNCKKDKTDPYAGPYGKRIEEDFYSEEDVEIIRSIIEYDGKSIGYVHMYKLNEELMNEYEYPITDKIVYGIDQFIGEPEYWDKGIGTKFMKLVLKYLFEEKKAEIVILDPHADNPRAIRCYEKVGFKKIKFLPKHELHDGELVDCFLMEVHK